METITKNVDETRALAKQLAKTFEKGDIVLLMGDLGAGKTTFVKYVVKALGGGADDVTSPTFTLVNEYKLNGFSVFHLDLYRLSDPNEIFNLGIEDYLYSNNICFVEWPERAIDIFESYKLIKIEKIDENKRKFIYDEGKDE